jgi:hypothetical protein
MARVKTIPLIIKELERYNFIVNQLYLGVTCSQVGEAN